MLQYLLGLLFLVLVVAVAPLGGQEARNGKAPPGKLPAARNAKGGAVLTPQREAAALSFVRQHHPELADLLAQLKTSKPKEYERAAQELFRTSERLALSQERDPERYELELKAWKVSSQVRLLAARLMMADNSALVQQLKDLIVEREELQLQTLLLERERLAARTEKLDGAIEKARKSRDELVQASVEQVLREIQQSRPKEKPLNKLPATK